MQNIIEQLIAFRDARDWAQFHTSKDLSSAIVIEAGELLELFLWKSNEEVDPARLAEELADVFSYCLLLANKHHLDVIKIIEDKIKTNSLKYPIEKAKGSAKKYLDL